MSFVMSSMNKKVFGKKFSRDSTSRRAMLRALVRSFVLNQSLVTTYSKARFIIPVLERLLSAAKKNTLSDRRFILSFTGNDREVTDKLTETAKKMPPIFGGYLKYTNLPARKGDNAPIAKVEFTKKIEVSEVKKEEVMDKKSGLKKAQKKTEDTGGGRRSVSSMIRKLPLRRKAGKK